MYKFESGDNIDCNVDDCYSPNEYTRDFNDSQLCKYHAREQGWVK